MAATLSKIKEVLVGAGLKVNTSFYRGDNLGTFTPLGLILHHDAAGLSYTDGWGGKDNASIAQYMSNPNNNGAQFWVSRSGVWYILSDQMRWHAGSGKGYGRIPAGSGNRYAYGIETDFGPRRGGWTGPTFTESGYTWPRWDQPHLNAIYVGSAALVKGLGLDSGSCCGHKEYAPDRKIDPAGGILNAWRAAIKVGPGPGPNPNPNPTPTPEDWFEMASKQDLVNVLADFFGTQAGNPKPKIRCSTVKDGKEVAQDATLSGAMGTAATMSSRASISSSGALSQSQANYNLLKQINGKIK